MNKILAFFKYLSSVTLLISFLHVETLACNCPQKSFCEYLYGNSPSLILKGEVIDTISYSALNIAVYFKVNNYIRNDFGINEDVIKIYGSNSGASCKVNVILHMPIGEEIYIALSEINYYPANNPDSLFENHYEVTPSLCRTNILNRRNKIIKGHIKTDTVSNEIRRLYNYPSEVFEERLLSNCNFNEEETLQDACREDNYQLYPNPVTRGNFFSIQVLYPKYEVEKVKIYSISGQLIQTLKPSEFYTFPLIECEFLINGVYVVQIESKGRIFTKKLIVNR